MSRWPRVASRHRASSIPMLSVLRGGRIVETVVGARPEHELRTVVERHLPAATEPRER